MTANNHPGVRDTLAVLERLRAAMRDFAAREEKLLREHASALVQLRRQFEQTLTERESRWAVAREETEAAFTAQQQAFKVAHEARTARIRQAYQNAKQRRLEQIESEDGRRKFEIQRDLLQTERDRDAALKAADDAFTTLTNDLAAEHQNLAGVEQRAQMDLRGYPRFVHLLAAPPAAGPPEPASPPDQLLETLRTTLAETGHALDRFRRLPGPLVFRLLPLWGWIGLIVFGAIGGVVLLPRFVGASVQLPHVIGAAVGALILVFLLHLLGGRQAARAATGVATALGRARRLYDRCREQSVVWHEQETARLRQEAAHRNATLQDEWNKNLNHTATHRADISLQVDLRAKRVLDRHEARRQARFDPLSHRHADQLAHGELLAATQRRALEADHAAKTQSAEANHRQAWQNLAGEWQGQVQPLWETLAALRATAEQLFPPWPASQWPSWSAPSEFAGAAQFARLDVDLPVFAGALPRDARLALLGPAQFTVPLLLALPEQASVLFETKQTGRDAVIAALNNIILRLLSVAPPGRVQFTILDAVELGQSFAGLMHLADFEERLISSRIWTQPAQIEEQLARLNEHIEKVTQMYLRNEYATLAEYNAQAGRIAEKYHFLVVADFPVNFSELAAKRLLSIAASGARCGVYTLIHWDQRKPAPTEFVPDELRRNSICLVAQGSTFTLAGPGLEGTTLHLDAPPDPERATEFLQRVGRQSVDSNRVEMPFAEVAPAPAELWSAETTTELRVPVGRTGATKLQYLALGKGTRQHALIAGKTGSGKSTLFHVIVTNLSLWCSPEQVEFYLVDFKKGVEFKCYATHRLPHARVVAIESDREFGLSVLQRVDEELKRRGDLFRRLEVQDLAGYKKAGGTVPLPRSLLLIDEFQEFFVEDDRVAQSAALLLDRIVRQGRAFGIHVVLGSQTLGGAYTLARATLGQMVVRIALQCNEADAYLIMDESNAAPRLLSRPGEAIYNDTAGTVEGNSPFQIVWLPDEERETQLQQVRARADALAEPPPGPMVFEGNAPAHVEENLILQRCLEAPSLQPADVPRVWLGAPNSIKGPTEVPFRHQSGNHLLLVGQREETMLALLGVSLVALAAQHPRAGARFILFDASPPGSAPRQFIEALVRVIPQETTLVTNATMDETLASLVEDLETRGAAGHAGDAPATYLFIHGVQKFKKLRFEEDFGLSLGDAEKTVPAGTRLNRIICEGASVGLHVLCACDTLNNVNRFLSRKALGEFELRVLFQMSANDSASLIDSPKANDLGLHRALFYNDQEGYLETFRPYSLPGREWLDTAARHLARLTS
jgi:hypothetical protein